MKPEETGPVFVIGCSRSGTTLVQSILSTNPKLHAFPESNVLYNVADDLDYRRYGLLIGRRRIPGLLISRLINRAGVTRSFSWRQQERNLPPCLSRHLRTNVDTRSFRIKSIFLEFTNMMLAASGGGRWIEKSPQNIFVVDIIERYIPSALFVHVKRDPLANIASLMQAASRYPDFNDRFGGPLGLRKAINYCLNARAITDSCSKRKRHMVVYYENLVTETSRELKRLEQFLSLEPDSLKPEYRTEGIALEHEHWKQGPDKITKQPNKATEVFTAEQISYINRRIRDAEG